MTRPAEASAPSPTLRGENAARRLVYHFATTSFAVTSPSLEALLAVDFQYGHLRAPAAAREAAAAVEVSVAVTAAGDEFEFQLGDRSHGPLRGAGHLLHELDNELAGALQQRAPHLYFVHAACLARGSSATIVMGESGAGKSTAAYALASRGLRYLSDELSPILPADRLVFPYPRAICLKNDPPAPLRLPRAALKSEWTVHVDPTELGATVTPEPARLDRIIFLSRPETPNHPRGRSGGCRRLSASEAALRLYQNALNQLAHRECGLDDTLDLVSGAECFHVERTDVEGTLAALGRAGVL